MTPASVDEVIVHGDRWPLVVSLYPVQVSDIDAFLRSFEASLDRVLSLRGGQPWLHLADVGSTQLYRANALERKRFADMLTRMSERFGSPLADAVILRNNIIRMIGMGITFLQNSAYPRKFFPDHASAEAWLERVGTEHGLVFPEAPGAPSR